MNRRGFLQSIAGLALVAACPAIAKPTTDLERLQAGIASGLIEGQTFTFYAPITIAANNLTIRNCRFIFIGTAETWVNINGTNIRLADARFDFPIRQLCPTDGSASAIDLVCAKDYAKPWHG